MKNSVKTIWPTPVFPHQGTSLGIVCLSAPEPVANPDNFNRGVAWLESRGFKVKLAPHVLKQNGFLAAPPSEVAADLIDMLNDPQIGLIVVAGGGSNSNRLLPYLDMEAVASACKPIVGLSNPTMLLTAISAATSLVTFHGPVLLWNFGGETPIDEATEQSLWEMLAHSEAHLALPAEPSWKWLREGSCQGRLLGGNLWSLQQLLGTPWQPDWHGAILAIEDCFCELHQVAAILDHFVAAGVFDEIAGLVVGISLEVSETELPYTGTFEDVVMESVGSRQIPILSGVHFGHTDKKLTLPLGSIMSLKSDCNSFQLADATIQFRD